MSLGHETCWSLIRRAAAGDGPSCNLFATTYLGIVRAFFAKRWRGTPAYGQIDDAVQEVFLDLFRHGGALARFDPDRARNFRSFLFGVTYNVARRHEERLSRPGAAAGAIDAEQLASPDRTLSRAFDRQWALRMVQRARARQLALAKTRGEEAERRVELLRLRFGEGRPVREIAAAWGEDPDRLHREYARARDEFKEALRAEVAFHMNGPPGQVEAECKSLLALLE